LKQDLINWLSRTEFNLFITTTLRQARQTDDGYWQRISHDDIRRTGWILRDRYTKAIVGKNRKLPFLAFCEGDGIDKRFHLHILTATTSELTHREHADLFRKVAARMEWVYDKIDARSIKPNEHSRVIGYSLKQGIASFIPEASFIA
jgi:hypothetical protein